VLTGAACGASTQAERVREARIETIDQQTVAKTRAIEDKEAARQEVIERNHDLAKANLPKGDDSAANASEQTLALSEDRALYESKARSRIDTIGVRLEAARKKMGAENGRAPADMRAKIEALEAVKDRMDQEVRDLPATPDAQWTDVKRGVDERLTSLNERVKDLTQHIEGS
jgi:hypothetical protein